MVAMPIGLERDPINWQLVADNILRTGIEKKPLESDPLMSKKAAPKHCRFDEGPISVGSVPVSALAQIHSSDSDHFVARAVCLGSELLIS